MSSVAVDDAVRIPLRRRDGSVRAYAVVDAADAEWVNQWRWCLDSNGYAYRTATSEGNRHTVYLHRELLDLPRATDGREGDHRDRDKLNCRRSNLRPLPNGKNPQNRTSVDGATSPHRGVSWHGGAGKWQASVKLNGKSTHLGYFTSEVAAADAARAARLKGLPYAVD